MPTITIDQEKCSADGLCMAECPFLLLTPREDGVPQLVKGAENMCVNCGHCMAVCPAGAISVGGADSADFPRTDAGLAVTIPQAMQLFRGRRSVRVFRKDPVPRADIETLIDMTRWAPTARNLQPVHWMVAEQPHVNRLAELVIEWMRRNGTLPEIVEAFENGRDMIHRNAPCLLIAHAHEASLSPQVDCAIALASVEVACQPMGLGACWAGFFMRAAKFYQPINEYLKLPEGHHVYGALMLGTPAHRLRRIPPRAAASVTWR
ncbi:nitroreductase family protein [Oleidesulfovibrio alaskensis]|uniref:nitroreductase family protein n=1 Tax=Oleidesulfovibrio alaskensis TaxID=58180 RepID=UPI000416545D|nr:nitroreductase family protein [Oleidesulfovibrio alaskensis]